MRHRQLLAKRRAGACSNTVWWLNPTGSAAVQALHHVPVELRVGNPSLGADELPIPDRFLRDPLAAGRSELRLDVLVARQFSSLGEARRHENLNAVADRENELAALGKLADE